MSNSMTIQITGSLIRAGILPCRVGKSSFPCDIPWPSRVIGKDLKIDKVRVCMRAMGVMAVHAGPFPRTEMAVMRKSAGIGQDKRLGMALEAEIIQSATIIIFWIKGVL